MINSMVPITRIKGARTNNLKNITVDIPQKKFTVVTGLSGSGKSSLVFDTLYAEGQRRFTESLSTYIRQFLEKMPRPDVDSIENINPAIALEQKNHINNSRSTVSTMSELHDYLRLFYAKTGETFCRNCETKVQKDSPQTVAEKLGAEFQGARFYILAPLAPQAFEKNHWKALKESLLGQGYHRLWTDGEVLEIEAQLKPPAAKSYLVIDRLATPEKASQDNRLMDALEQGFSQGDGRLVLAFPEEKKWKQLAFSNRFRCETCSTDYLPPSPQLLSFNSALGACKTCNGFGATLEVSEKLVIPNPKLSLEKGAIDPFTKPSLRSEGKDLLKFCKLHGISTTKRYADLTAPEKKLLWDGDPKKKNGFNGLIKFFEDLKDWKYKVHIRIFIRRYQESVICKTCQGARLIPDALCVRIHRKNMAQVQELSIADAKLWFESIPLSKMQKQAAKDILFQVQTRLKFLVDLGVGYLPLNRLAKTLSGGECQRIYLASQLGNRLCSTLYILDEPSIGLHASDVNRLIQVLHELRDNGNTVVVVEHDLEVIKASDYVVELGPQAGAAGGSLVTQNEFEDFQHNANSLTAKYIQGELFIEKRKTSRPTATQFLKITGASENNLKDVTVEIPLKTFTCVTGLSGSGKTTLIHHTLYNALHRIFHKNTVPVGRFQKIYGTDLISDVVLLDQKPIGRSSRSNPATYLGIYDDIRKIYSNQSLSVRRGYSPKYFSFNVDGGRCPTCKGEGEVTMDMHFMADLKLPCDTCNGKKFKKDVLEVEFKQKNIFQLLNTTVDECIHLFREYNSISQKLQILKKVGLGYLSIGQSSTSLSGGESQRLKIASALMDHTKTNVLFIFDEPTTGLHIDDVKRLISVLQYLVDQENTVLVIEHNLELISQADHIIDLGPGAGASGGEIVAQGTPEEIMNSPRSLTGSCLQDSGILARREPIYEK